MTRTVTRLFDSHTEALAALSELERAGIDQDDISLVSNNADNWHEGHKHSSGEAAGGPLGDRNGDGDNDVADGAGKGATRGGLIGGAGGLLAGLGMLAIPGLGPVVAAGWLASTAVGAAVGAAAGGATGGLLGALKEAGHSDDEAHTYAEGVRRGGTLVSIRARDEDATRIEQILHQQSGVDAASRGQVYRAGGWERFDYDAQPYSREQIEAERRQHREQRSFLNQEPRGLDDDERVRREGGASGLSTPIPGTEI